MMDSGDACGKLPMASECAGVKRSVPADSRLLPQNCSYFVGTGLKKISRKRRRIEWPAPRHSSRVLHFPANIKKGSAPCYQRDEDRRTLRYQVAPSLRPLWKLDSVADFENCYVDIVETHFRAYEHGILHRDISDETTVVQRSGGIDVGVLVDWDISCFACDNADAEGNISYKRRGVSPFMAIDLQFVTMDGKLLPLHHRYCHDLEALFWLLLWAVIHFDTPQKRRLPCRIPKWGYGAWADVASFKHCILTAPNTRQGVLDLALPNYEDLIERWVVPLSFMFRKARDDAEDIDEQRKWFFNAELYAKEATFGKFMATIQRKPRTW